MDRNQLVKALQWEWTEWMERIEPCVEIGEVGGRIFSFGEIKSAKVEWGNLSPHGLELTLHFEFKWRAKRGEDYKWERDTDTLDIQVYYQEDENPVSLYFHKQNSPLILRCLGFNIRKHQLWEIMGIPQPPRPKTNANAWLSIVTQGPGKCQIRAQRDSTILFQGEVENIYAVGETFQGVEATLKWAAKPARYQEGWVQTLDPSILCFEPEAVAYFAMQWAEQGSPAKDRVEIRIPEQRIVCLLIQEGDLNYLDPNKVKEQPSVK